MPRFSPVVAILASLLPGCDTDPTATEPIRRYTAQVAGPVNRTLTGQANFTVGSTGYGGSMIAIVLRDETRDNLILLESGGVRPAVGVYQVVEGTEPQPGRWLGTYQLRENGEIRGTFVAGAGEVRVLESTADRIRGKFWFQATGYLDGEVGVPVQLTVHGDFDAGPGGGLPSEWRTASDDGEPGRRSPRAMAIRHGE